MQNQEIFEKLVNKIGDSYSKAITEVISILYDIKFNAAKTVEASEEYDYERQWWMNKHLELIK